MSYIEELFKSGVWGTKKPNEPEWIKWAHRNLSQNHCEECLKLDGCYFFKEKTPKYPHHPYCHCVLEPISYNTVLKNAKTISDYSKFDPYLFNRNNKYTHNKEKLFHKWGYTIDDSAWLQKEIEKQAHEKYIDGNYLLGKLNDKGQRITIRITIPRKNSSENVSFISGWMVLPNGQIKLTTPYGGK